MKRIIAIVVLLTLSAIALTGCGENAPKVNNLKAKDANGNDVHVATHAKFDLDPGYRVRGFRYDGMDCLTTDNYGGGIWCDNSAKTAKLVRAEIDAALGHPAQAGDEQLAKDIQKALDDAAARDSGK